ncbi:hypothetical protein CCH79_00015799 [Gambusia affinis]|uniref:WD repeat containing planar cell polarity effector n=1 Tax=Gambusia affinis TaxID=33528 RepID=A0A315USZ3_GAMAF|nr:hypothetical protein CCH79_00015799 [Gambusia affinis]
MSIQELLQSNTCVHTRWRSKYCCQLMLSNGVLVTVTLKGPQLDQVCVDRTLVGRLPANTVTDAVLSDRLVLLSFLEQSQVAGVYLNKKSQDSLETGRRTDKLSPSEIKVMCVEVGGPGGGLRRRVALNRLQDVALCWWTLDELSEGMWPWTPADTHKNNLFLISCSPTEGLKVLCSVRTTGNPLDCCFSQLQHYQMLTVELPTGPQGLSAVTCVYECARGRLHRTSITSIPLPSLPVSCSRHPCETTLLLGLSDSSLVLYDQRRAVSVLASCPVLPSYMAWHPAGAVAILVGGQEEVMCFDMGLAPLNMALVAEEAAPAATLRLTQHLNCSGGLAGLQWGAGLDGGPEGTDTLTLVFNGGPLAALKFRLGALTGGQLGHVELLQQRLRCGQVREALGILEAMDWSTMGDKSYQGLSSVTNHLLRLPLNADREAQLETALRVFYAPAAPLSDAVILEYREPVTKYARRLFHHLLRPSFYRVLLEIKQKLYFQAGCSSVMCSSWSVVWHPSSSLITYLHSFPLHQHQIKKASALCLFICFMLNRFVCISVDFGKALRKMHQRFEKAFLLAVDLEAQDLFMHWNMFYTEPDLIISQDNDTEGLWLNPGTGKQTWVEHRKENLCTAKLVGVKHLLCYLSKPQRPREQQLIVCKE